MSNYVPFEEAAKQLGITTEALTEMISRSEIFGYRDGASWKFKPDEIARVLEEMSGSILDDPGGSSLLLSESQLGGGSGSKSGSTLGGDKGKKSSGSDVADELGSDVALVPDPSSGSGVRLVNRSTAKANDNDLKILDDKDSLKLGEAAPSDIKLPVSGGSGSEIDLGDLTLDSDVEAGSKSSAPGKKKPDSDVLGSVNLTPGSSGGTGAGSSDALGDLELADDDGDDLVLGSGSGISMGGDSGINLMSPSDSGLSLEDEPLDLAGTGISGLDLAGEGSGTGSAASSSASGSLVDFQQSEEFQLSPSSGIEADEDSGSQVIELEDSAEFGGAAVGLPGADDALGGGFEGDAGGFGDGGFGFDDTAATAGAAAAARAVPDIPYNSVDVGLLLATLFFFGISGIFVTDIVRNMWSWSDSSNPSSLTSWLTQMVIDSVGMK
jgi:hypothetical protein